MHRKQKAVRTKPLQERREQKAVSGLFMGLLLLVPVVGWTANPITVEVVEPKEQDIRREISLPGTLKPWQETVLYAKVSGYLSEIKVDIGDRVKKGKVVATLDIPEMVPQLENAETHILEAHALLAQAVVEASASQAQANAFLQKERATRASLQQLEVEKNVKKSILDRFESLKRDRAITDQELEEARGNYESARARYEAAKAEVQAAHADTQSALSQVQVSRSKIEVAKADLTSAHAESKRLQVLSSYASVTAPFDGVITERFVDPGHLVIEGMSSRGTPIVRLVQDNRLRLQFNLPEKEVPHVAVGTPVSFIPDALPHHESNAKVSRLAGELDPDTRTMIGEIDLENPQGSLKPGMFVRLRIQLGLDEKALTVPASTLVVEEGRTFVWVIENNIAKKIPVEIGYDDGETIEVTNGLGKDAHVVVSGQSFLEEGSQVRVVSPK